MKKHLLLLAFISCCAQAVPARDLYVSPTGSDQSDGSMETPFATLAAAQKIVQPGDKVYFRGGIYRPTVNESMGEKNGIYSCAYILDKSGEQGNPICYLAYPGERPVFDMAEYRPSGKRVSVFYISGSWLHIKGLEVIHTQVTITNQGNTQSECFSVRGGNNNIFENLKMHDGMAIGWYLVKGSNNLVLNCDAWNNYDPGNGGGNVDGFGCHPAKGDKGNIIRNCRAWWNSDDGYDLIHSAEAVWIDRCWAFYNGYKPGSFDSAADGNGIKAGGYGMNEDSKIADEIPMHRVTNCLAYRNKSAGFYSNHHLGGIEWVNNTGVENRWNYNMVNRKSVEEATDVDGYNHFLANNISFAPRDKDCTMLDLTKSTVINNSFAPEILKLSANDFVSMNPGELTAIRQDDGQLPDVSFYIPQATSEAALSKMGYSFPAPGMDEILSEQENNKQWIMAPMIVSDGQSAWIEGAEPDLVNGFYANTVKLSVKNGKVSLSSIQAKTIHLKATLSTGVIITLTINRE